MKKFMLLLLLGTVLTTAVSAQSKDVKDDKRVLKNTIVDKKEDRREAGKDVTHLRAKAALRHRREVRRHRKSIHRQGEHLENHGVKHPIRKAKYQAKAEKDARKGRD